jgi:uncharacterized membrane protein YqhA
MLRFVLSLRLAILIAALGAALGAVLMFIEGAHKLLDAALTVFQAEQGPSVIGPVMAATDTLFFAIVLIIFAYSITFGFAIHVPRDTERKMPRWMRIDDINELKQTLASVVLLFFIVDFATDWWANETSPSWLVLVKPVSILMIAGAMRLVASSHDRPQVDPEGSSG